MRTVMAREMLDSSRAQLSWSLCSLYVKSISLTLSVSLSLSLYPTTHLLNSHPRHQVNLAMTESILWTTFSKQIGTFNSKRTKTPYKQYMETSLIDSANTSLNDFYPKFRSWKGVTCNRKYVFSRFFFLKYTWPIVFPEGILIPFY